MQCSGASLSLVLVVLLCVMEGAAGHRRSIRRTYYRPRSRTVYSGGSRYYPKYNYGGYIGLRAGSGGYYNNFNTFYRHRDVDHGDLADEISDRIDGGLGGLGGGGLMPNTGGEGPIVFRLPTSVINDPNFKMADLPFYLSSGIFDADSLPDTLGRLYYGAPTRIVDPLPVGGTLLNGGANLLGNTNNVLGNTILSGANTNAFAGSNVLAGNTNALGNNLLGSNGLGGNILGNTNPNHLTGANNVLGNNLLANANTNTNNLLANANTNTNNLLANTNANINLLTGGNTNGLGVGGVSTGVGAGAGTGAGVNYLGTGGNNLLTNTGAGANNFLGSGGRVTPCSSEAAACFCTLYSARPCPSTVYRGQSLCCPNLPSGAIDTSTGQCRCVSPA